jgi:hypothetical protein
MTNQIHEEDFKVRTLLVHLDFTSWRTCVKVAYVTRSAALVFEHMAPYVPTFSPRLVGRQSALWNHCYGLWPTSCEFANGHIPSTHSIPKLITTKSNVANLYNWLWHTFIVIMKLNIKSSYLCTNFNKKPIASINGSTIASPRRRCMSMRRSKLTYTWAKHSIKLKY